MSIHFRFESSPIESEVEPITSTPNKQNTQFHSAYVHWRPTSVLDEIDPSTRLQAALYILLTRRPKAGSQNQLVSLRGQNKTKRNETIRLVGFFHFHFHFRFRCPASVGFVHCWQAKMSMVDFVVNRFNPAASSPNQFQ